MKSLLSTRIMNLFLKCGKMHQSSKKEHFHKLENTPIFSQNKKNINQINVDIQNDYLLLDDNKKSNWQFSFYRLDSSYECEVAKRNMQVLYTRTYNEMYAIGIIDQKPTVQSRFAYSTQRLNFKTVISVFLLKKVQFIVQ